jgi:hypothetical protein
MSKSRYKTELAKWGMRDPSLDIVFVTPEGAKIDELSPGAVKNPDSLAQKMGLVLKSYAQSVYEKEVKPVLEDENADPKKLTAALQTVEDFSTTAADEAVLKLLKRQGLNEAVSAKALTVLGKLATQPAVDELFGRAANDRKADDALRKAPPIAAEHLLSHLGGPDAAKHVLAYEIVCAICKIKDPKKAVFWEGTREKPKTDEINRVKKIATQQAAKWKERHEQYR